MLVPSERIAHSILLLRGQKVLLDTELAELYGIQTKVLVQAIKRNLDRFPGDFMFQLTNQEFNILRSQSVTSRLTHGGRRTTPYAFTEQGVAMLSSVLSSPQAIAGILDAIRQLMAPPPATKKRSIGFISSEK